MLIDWPKLNNLVIVHQVAIGGIYVGKFYQAIIMMVASYSLLL